MNPGKKLIIGSNLKMYKTIAETIDYLTQLQNLTADLSKEDICLFIIPSYTSLPAASKFKNGILRMGAQNMNWEESGQFTGEISPLMLEELGLDIVEVGHSERRYIFGETDQEENKKVLAALNHGFTALLCIGETVADKDLGISIEKLRIQLKIGLRDVPEDQLSRLWIAYEPVWAIGVDGIPASPEYANSMHAQIRKTLVELYPKGGESIPVLYGGSVNQDNCSELIVQPDIDGLFIGRSAWNADDMNAIIRAILPLWQNK
jgi:L-erythrulose 1-phosphate isomerase